MEDAKTGTSEGGDRVGSLHQLRECKTIPFAKRNAVRRQDTDSAEEEFDTYTSALSNELNAIRVAAADLADALMNVITPGINELHAAIERLRNVTRPRR